MDAKSRYAQLQSTTFLSYKLVISIGICHPVCMSREVALLLHVSHTLDCLYVQSVGLIADNDVQYRSRSSWPILENELANWRNTFANNVFCIYAEKIEK